MSGTTAGTKMLQAMSEVGSTPLLALLMAYQPQEASLAAQQQQEQQQPQEQEQGGGQNAKPVLNLPFDAAAVVNSEEIQWVCMDSAKPVSGRDSVCACWGQLQRFLPRVCAEL